jgi:hypothetical protein
LFDAFDRPDSLNVPTLIDESVSILHTAEPLRTLFLGIKPLILSFMGVFA